MTFELEVSLE